ncbi:MAG: TraR/DksA family transcriptional regulator [Candidatus Omnitrophota bacterium]
MAAADLQKYRALLLKKKEILVNDIKHISSDNLSKSQRDATGELSGYTFHMADVATDNYDREFGMGLAATEQKVIWAIDEALGRIQDRSFGFCQSCEKKISKKRLTAVPYAKFCVDCQSKEEKRAKEKR